jgi:hypothetical protein
MDWLLSKSDDTGSPLAKLEYSNSFRVKLNKNFSRYYEMIKGKVIKNF